MADIRNEKEKLTLKQTSGSRVCVFAALALALCGDVLGMIFLGISGAGGSFFVFPVLLLSLDAVAVPVAAISNFRFRYSFISVAAYCVLAPLFLALIAVFDAHAGGGRVMSTVALVLLLVMHAAAVIAFAAGALRAAAVGRLPMAVVSFAVIALLAAAVAAYAVSLSGGGFFGQGFNRPLVFTYDAEADCYNVTGVADGGGEIITVPGEFDGKRVGSVDCSVFSAEGVTRVELRCGADVTFVNYSAADGMNGVAVVADKAVIDEFRNKFYAAGSFTLGNAMIPDGEGVAAYAVFDYDADSYAFSGRKVLPTWTGSDIADFDIADYAADPDFAYAAYTDVTNPDHLHRAVRENGGYIMHAVGDSDGSCVDALVTFERVYRVTFGADNDSKFSGYEGIEDNGSGCKYTIADNAGDLLSSCARGGFSVVWHIGSPTSGTLVSPVSFGNILENSETYFTNGITVCPYWTLDAPTVSINGSGSAMYYDEWTVSANATPPVGGYELTYSWSGKGSGSDESYSIEHIAVSDGGTYTVTVTAGNNEYTSLTSRASASISLTVDPRPLTVEWKLDGGDMAGSYVYDGSAHTVSVEVSGLVNDDTLDPSYYSLSETSVRDAETYRLSMTLKDDDFGKKYSLENPSYALTINKRTVDVSWSGSTSKTYDGQQLTITASATGVGEESGTELLFATSFSGTNAGSYTANAALKNEYARNYALNNPSLDYTIYKKSVTLVWTAERSFEYDGSEHGISVTDIDGAVSGEPSSLLSSLTYSGAQRNAGEHTMTAIIPENDVWANYSCTDNTETFSITRRDLVIKINDGGKTYDGRAYSFGQSICVLDVENGYVDGDDVTVEFAGEAVTATDAGTYSFTATAAGTDAGNYSITVSYNSERDYGVIAISRKSVTLVWQSDRSLVYDGRAQGISVTGVSGAVSGDLSSLLAALTYSGSQRNVGDGYTMTANIPTGGVWSNYTCADSTETFSVTPRTLTITVNGASKTYDGRAYAFGTNDYESDGLAGDDGLTVTFGGDAVTATDAGTYSFTATYDLGDNAGNYSVTVRYSSGSAGSLTIRKAALTITVRDASKTADGSVYAFGEDDYSISGLVSGDSVTVTFDGEAVTAVSEGTYSFTAAAGGPDASNYDITITYARGGSGTLTITSEEGGAEDEVQ